MSVNTPPRIMTQFKCKHNLYKGLCRICNMKDENAALKQRIAELEAQMQWQPIESAPKDELILIWNSARTRKELNEIFPPEYNRVQVPLANEPDHVVLENVGYCVAKWKQEYWMPLPKAPEAKS